MNAPQEQTTEQCRLCSYTIGSDETEIDGDGSEAAVVTDDSNGVVTIHQHIMDEHSLRERLFALHETVTVSDEVSG